MEALLLTQFCKNLFSELFWGLVQILFVNFVAESEGCFDVLVLLILSVGSFESLPHNIVLQDSLE
jgi:hypothetical protein